MIKTILKTLLVLKNRFIFRNKLRVSEVVDIFTDNLYRFVPRDRMKSAYEFLNRIIDRILWL